MNKFFSRRGNKRGFTLIELLVVVLILAILMAVALPLYLSAVADSERKTCRANMQTIANAVQAGKVRTRSATFFTGTVDATAVAGALADLQAVPKCPEAPANTYSVAASSGGAGNGFTISCSETTHGTFTPGVDNS